ncbi:NADP-dependent oxidoreductase [Rhabdaerophilum sp.]|uniref:NADP-dependent oxidoreductase n=1 Tax=Rhabdaerophilum sp. TaxID=2717341 RepID=UPI0038D448B6
METNRRWVLARRPKTLVSPADFRLEEVPVPAPAEGEFLIRQHYLSLAPVMAQYVLDGGTIERPVAIGETMRGRGVGRVVASRHPKFRIGDVVHGPFGWQDYALSNGARLTYVSRYAGRIAPMSTAIGVLGITGYTAYFGMKLADPKPGDRILVSGAVGGVGSSVGQIARIMGCTPIVAVCGGPEKAATAIHRLGYDSAIDYRRGALDEAIDDHMPDGLDIYFDNVGGATLEAALNRMRQGARIILCGAISQYMADGKPVGPSNYFKLVYANAQMKGFQIYAFADRYAEAEEALADWIASGRLVWQENLLEGLEIMPKALAGLFEGTNVGKQVVRIAPETAT